MPRLRFAKDSGRCRSSDLRRTPASTKSYGAAGSRLYTFNVKRWWLVVVIVLVLVLVGARYFGLR